MSGRARTTARPRRRIPWPALAWALTFALVATLAAPAVTRPADTGQPVTLAAPPQVRAPRPAPGAVVQAGPVVVAADVAGADPAAVTLLVDGEPVSGVAVDPDGSLSPLVGVEVTLSPGPHRLAVAVGTHGVLREWDVIASGLEIQHAEEDAAGLVRRLHAATPRHDVALLVDLSDPRLAVAASPLAAMLDATVLPTDDTAIPPATWSALRAMTADGEGATEVVLLGGPSVLDPVIADTLTTAGFATTRIDGESAVQLATAGATVAMDRIRDPAPALVVGPAAPLDRALTAAMTAARSGATFLLVDDVLGADTAAVIARHPTVLLSTDLAPAARDAVVAAMAPDAVASDHDMAPTGAREAVVVADHAQEGQLVAATLAAAPGRAVVLGDAAATRWVGHHQPERVTLVGATPPATGSPAIPRATPPPLSLAQMAVMPAIDPHAPAAEPAPPAAATTTAALAPALQDAWVDGPDRPQVAAVVDPSDGLRVALSAPEPITHAQIHVTLLDQEWPGSVQVEGLDATWTAGDRPALPLPLEPASPDTPTTVDVTAALVVGDRTVHQRFTTSVAISPRPTTSPEGWIVAGGATGVTGDRGPLYTYSVEIEPQTGLDIAEVEAEITSILTDPRSWTGGSDVRLRRIGTSQALLRVVVATPATVDAFCGAAGLRTGGRVSCWDGRRAMLNLDRWTLGVPHFGGDLVTYRQYLVNHEVGHGLTHGHEGCPRPGALAPIMMQQTGGVGACQPNGWPFP